MTTSEKKILFDMYIENEYNAEHCADYDCKKSFSGSAIALFNLMTKLGIMSDFYRYEAKVKVVENEK